MTYKDDILYSLGYIEDNVYDMQTSLTNILREIKDVDEDVTDNFEYWQKRTEELEDDNKELKSKIEKAIFHINLYLDCEKEQKEKLKDILIGD